MNGTANNMNKSIKKQKAVTPAGWVFFGIICLMFLLLLLGWFELLMILQFFLLIILFFMLLQAKGEVQSWEEGSKKHNEQYHHDNK